MGCSWRNAVRYRGAGPLRQAACKPSGGSAGATSVGIARDPTRALRPLMRRAEVVSSTSPSGAAPNQCNCVASAATSPRISRPVTARRAGAQARAGDRSGGLGDPLLREPSPPARTASKARPASWARRRSARHAHVHAGVCRSRRQRASPACRAIPGAAAVTSAPTARCPRCVSGMPAWAAHQASAAVTPGTPRKGDAVGAGTPAPSPPRPRGHRQVAPALAGPRGRASSRAWICACVVWWVPASLADFDELCVAPIEHVATHGRPVMQDHVGLSLSARMPQQGEQAPGSPGPRRPAPRSRSAARAPWDGSSQAVRSASSHAAAAQRGHRTSNGARRNVAARRGWSACADARAVARRQRRQRCRGRSSGRSMRSAQQARQHRRRARRRSPR